MNSINMKNALTLHDFRDNWKTIENLPRLFPDPEE